MKKYFITVVIFLSILSSKSFSQTTYSLAAGGGIISGSLDGVRLPYWENGALADLSAERFINTSTSIFINGSYEKFNFSSNLVHVVLADSSGQNTIVKGDKSTVYEVTAGGRFYMSKSQIKPFLTLGLGFLSIQQGKVYEITQSSGKNGNDSTLLAGSNQKYFVGQYTLGFGFYFDFYKNIGLSVEAKLIGTLGQGSSSYIPIYAAVRYGF